MRKLSVTVATLAMGTMVALPAMAKDLDGRFGLGYDQSLSGVSGLTARYWIGDLGIQGILGLDFVKPDQGDSQIEFDFGLGAIYNFAKSEHANLGLGLNLDLGFANKAAMGGGDSSFQFNVAIPLRGEYFLSDNFAFNASVGLVIAIVPEKGQVLGAMSATGHPGAAAKDIQFSLGPGNLFATGGFTYYF